MNQSSNIKHAIFLFIVVFILASLALILERSELNNINIIKISGGLHLSNSSYLKFAELEQPLDNKKLSLPLIQNRLEKHPYIKDVDVEFLDRGVVQVIVFEKKMDALLIGKSSMFMITDKAEIIPFIHSTQSLDIPIIINQKGNTKINLFSNACRFPELFCALKIISTAEKYDKYLYNNISEINLNNKTNIEVNLSNLSAPIYFGINNEIEKTVYLSKVLNRVKDNSIIKHLNYVDLRFNELVYLGYDEKKYSDKEII